MSISRRMGVTICGLAIAGATVVTVGAAGPANAQTASITPQQTVTGYALADKHRRWRHGGWTYDYWYWSGCGCGCC